MSDNPPTKDEAATSAPPKIEGSSDSKTPKKASTQKSKTKSKKSKKITLALCFFTLILGSFFPAASLVVAIGMIPTFIILVLSPKELRIRALTIGALNFVGCFPFIIEVSKSGYMPSKGLEIVSDPFNIVIMYLAAALGYVFEWSIIQATRTVLLQKANLRQKAIAKKQKNLIETWGKRVVGDAKSDDQDTASDRDESHKSSDKDAN